MEMTLSQKQIGTRIQKLRKQKGFSQEEIAKLIGISRPSFVQIENGKRNVDIQEMAALANVLEFSIDAFLAEDFHIENRSKIQQDEEKKNSPEIRISVPKFNREKFENVLLYILERCAGKPNIGETTINKLLYFCDFNYYELYEEHLTGASYKKMSFGPVPQRANSIIIQMINQGKIERIKTEYFGYHQTRFLPLKKANLTKLSAAELIVIDNVIQQMSDWNANKISEYSHKDMPWLATEMGEKISYNLAFYRELPYSVHVYDENHE